MCKTIFTWIAEKIYEQKANQIDHNIAFGWNDRLEEKIAQSKMFQNNNSRDSPLKIPFKVKHKLLLLATTMKFVTDVCRTITKTEKHNILFCCTCMCRNNRYYFAQVFSGKLIIIRNSSIDLNGINGWNTMQS